MVAADGYYAGDPGYGASGQSDRQQNTRANRDKQKATYQSLSWTNPAHLQGRPIPVQPWVVENWLPRGAVTLCYSPPGEGKTLIALQLMVSAALGVPWLGLPVHRFFAIGLFCEDDAAEVHRRLNRILRAYGADFSDLDEGMVWASPIGDDNTLVRFAPDGEMEVTDRYLDLYRQVGEMKADLVVVDTAADLYGGNENDRVQVSAFLKQALGRIAIDYNCAVLVNAHPSKSSVAKGAQDFDSGSTAWTGSARARWALVTPRDEDGTIPDRSARILSVTKSNYGPTGLEMRLRWADGSFECEEKPRMPGAPVQHEHDAKFITLLRRCHEKGQHASPSKNASSYAPKLVRKWPDGGLYTQGEYEKAMYRLLAAGDIEIENYGPPSKLAQRLIFADRSDIDPYHDA